MKKKIALFSLVAMFAFGTALTAQTAQKKSEPTKKEVKSEKKEDCTKSEKKSDAKGCCKAEQKSDCKK